MGRPGGWGRLQCGATNSYVRVPHSAIIQGSTAFTVSAWVRTGSGVTAEQHIASKSYLSPSNQIGWRFYIHSDVFKFYLSSDGGSSNRCFRDSVTVAASRWYHVACVFLSSTTCDIYLDGVLSNGSLTGSLVSSVYATTGDLILGAQATTTTTTQNTFGGSLDDLRIYSRDLSDGEVKELYKSSKNYYKDVLNFRKPKRPIDSEKFRFR